MDSERECQLLTVARCLQEEELKVEKNFHTDKCGEWRVKSGVVALLEALLFPHIYSKIKWIERIVGDGFNHFTLHSPNSTLKQR